MNGKNVLQHSVPNPKLWINTSTKVSYNIRNLFIYSLMITFIALVADTIHLVGLMALIACPSKLTAAARAIWTHTGAAVLSRSQDRVAIITMQTSV